MTAKEYVERLQKVEGVSDVKLLTSNDVKLRSVTLRNKKNEEYQTWRLLVNGETWMKIQCLPSVLTQLLGQCSKLSPEMVIALLSPIMSGITVTYCSFNATIGSVIPLPNGDEVTVGGEEYSGDEESLEYVVACESSLTKEATLVAESLSKELRETLLSAAKAALMKSFGL